MLKSMGDESSDVDQRVVAETGVDTIRLQHALAFKDTSGQLFHDAVGQIKTLSSADSLYPPYIPGNMVSLQSSLKDASPVSTRPLSNDEGRISPAEAAAMTVLLIEHSALNQGLFRSGVQQRMNDVLQLPRNGWAHDVVTGMSTFSNEMRIAAAARDNRRTEPDEEDKKTLDAITADGGVLGEKTATLLQGRIGQTAEELIPNHPGGARNADEIQQRIASIKHGAKLARELYVEAFGLAKRELPSTISRSSGSARDTLRQLTEGK